MVEHPFRFKITRPSSLLSTIIDEEITEDEARILVEALIRYRVEPEKQITAVPWDHSDEDSVNGTIEWEQSAKDWIDWMGNHPSNEMEKYQRESR